MDEQQLRAWIFRIIAEAKGRAGSGRRLAALLGINSATVNRWAIDGPLPALEDFSKVLHWLGGNLSRADPHWRPSEGELAQENQRLRELTEQLSTDLEALQNWKKSVVSFMEAQIESEPIIRAAGLSVGEPYLSPSVSPRRERQLQSAAGLHSATPSVPLPLPKGRKSKGG
jgi:transcriptional regulator with XRE-family HTH domain